MFQLLVQETRPWFDKVNIRDCLSNEAMRQMQEFVFMGELADDRWAKIINMTVQSFKNKRKHLLKSIKKHLVGKEMFY